VQDRVTFLCVFLLDNMKGEIAKIFILISLTVIEGSCYQIILYVHFKFILASENRSYSHHCSDIPTGLLKDLI
jgi:hypothetical protein